MTILKMAFHSRTGRRIVEVFDDAGRMVGCVYPTDDGSNAIHIVSAHFDGEPAPSEGVIPIPGFLIKFRKAFG